MGFKAYLTQLPLHVGAMRFTTKLYLAGLLTTIVVFIAMGITGSVFYDKMTRLHQITLEAKSVRLNLAEIQAQSFAYDATNNPLHYQIHQHALQELQRNVRSLLEQVQILHQHQEQSQINLQNIQQLAQVMQENVALYASNFQLQRKQQEMFKQQREVLHQAMFDSLSDTTTWLLRLADQRLMQPMLLLRQYEQAYISANVAGYMLGQVVGHGVTNGAKGEDSPNVYQQSIQEITSMTTIVVNMPSSKAAQALLLSLQAHGDALRQLEQLRQNYAKTMQPIQLAEALGSIGLDAYDVEDIVLVMTEETRAQLIKTALFVLALLLLVAVAVNRLVAGSLMRPLLELTDMANHVGADNFNVKARVFSRDEVGVLASAFNEMIDSIQTSRHALVASEQYEAQQVMLAMREGLVVLDAQATIMKVNPAICTLLDYTEQQLVGLPFSDFVDFADIAVLLDTKHSNIQQLQHKNGELLPTMILGSPRYDDAGSYEGAVLVINDMRQYLAVVADKEQAEQSLAAEQHQRLESLGLMAGGIAHDFNNLLTPIICNSEILLQATKGDDKLQHRVRQTLDAAQHASRLSKQMLAYSGSGRLASESIRVDTLLESMQQVLGATVSQQVSLKFEIEQQPACFDGDVAELEQVLLNIVINAADASAAQGGEVRIATIRQHIDQVYLDAAQTFCKPNLQVGDYVGFAVQDFGCGMSAEVLKKLFDPFFTTKFTGRGLGLSAVLGILQNHQGVLHVNTQQGVGSTFTVCFPVVAEVVPDAQLSVAPVAVSEKPFTGHILIVDDDEAVLDVLDAMLDNLGCTTVQACNGLEGVEAYANQSKQIDAVILDMTMPVMSGAKCFAELIKINAEVKVILSSGYTQDDIETMFPTEKLIAYLQKPYDHQRLVETLQLLSA